MIPVTHAPVAICLPPQQIRCLALMSHGLSNSAIGRRMGLSENTVKTHLYLAYRGLGVHDRGHAVRRCYELGIFRLARAS
jgi:DNA-binding NarL/FixJ family response regulator